VHLCCFYLLLCNAVAITAHLGSLAAPLLFPALYRLLLATAPSFCLMRRVLLFHLSAFSTFRLPLLFVPCCLVFVDWCPIMEAT
jgi:hypothetical protein